MFKVIAVSALMIQSYIVTEDDYARLNSNNEDFEFLVNMLNHVMQTDNFLGLFSVTGVTRVGLYDLSRYFDSLDDAMLLRDFSLPSYYVNGTMCLYDIYRAFSKKLLSQKNQAVKYCQRVTVFSTTAYERSECMLAHGRQTIPERGVAKSRKLLKF